MAIVIEDGSIVSGANSYASEAELQAYADARGVIIAGLAVEDLIKAMDYLEVQPFIGLKATQGQPLQWPRDGVVIDGWAYTSTNLPDELKEAQLVIAMGIDQGLDPLANIDPGIKRTRVKAGSVESEKEYQDGAPARAVSVAISRALAKLVAAGGGSNFAVTRG